MATTLPASFVGPDVAVGQVDYAALLRRVADTIETIHGALLLDLALHKEIADGGDRFSVTVYSSLPSGAE